MRTRERICQAKQRYPGRAAADLVATRFDHAVRAYHCDRCHGWHLTSRLKGKRRPRPKPGETNASQAGLPDDIPSGSGNSGLVETP